MKKAQNNRYNMHLATQSVLNKNAVKLASIAGYPELKARIDSSIAKEEELAIYQNVLKTVTATAKNNARNSSAQYTLDLASKVRAVAFMAGDITLLEKAKLTATDIIRGSDIALLATFSNVLKYAGENLASLAGYGVTSETIAEGKALLKAYETEILQLATNKTKLTVITQQLEKQLRATLALIHKADAIIETLRISDPEIYSLYWNARAKRNSACTKVSVKGRVYEEATNMPLPGAELTVLHTDAGNMQTAAGEPVRKIHIRSKKGGFRFKLFTSGVYLFKVTYYGCTPYETTVYFNEGVLTQVELPLTRIEEDK